MIRIDLLNFSAFGKVSDLENLLSNNQIDKLSLSKAIFKCIEAKDFTQDHIETIKLLLSYGAEVNTKDQKYNSFLMHACAKGNLELVRTLLVYGADPKDVDRQNRTTIILALTNQTSDPVEIVKLLKENDVNIMARDLGGQTALHVAAINGHKDSIDYLISCKAEVNSQDTNQDTPLHLVFRRDKKNCIDPLLQYTNRDIKNLKGKTPLDEAHGKSLAYLNAKKYPKDEPWENRRSRGKLRGKNYNKRERDLGECFKCKQIIETYCLECASNYLQNYDKDMESIERKNRLEIEEFLRMANIRIKELEKENAEIKENISTQNNNYIVKIKKSALYLKQSKEKTYDQLKDQLQNDITNFVRDQERWRQKINQPYEEAINVFKEVIQDTFKSSKIDIFGSFATGLLLPYSDIDLVISGITSPTLIALKELIPKIDGLNIVRKSDKIFTAAIPLLKAYTEIRQQEVKLDITIQEPKHRGLECTILVRKFLSTYNTINHVFLVLKQLMYYTNFHEPYKGGISSYGLFLMLVYFYQENANDWNVVNAEKQKNEAEVLIRFFEYYIHTFTYTKYIVIDYENWDNKDLKNKTVIIN